MVHYELRQATLGAVALEFEEGRLWQQPDGDWGVDLRGLYGLRQLDWRHVLRFEAETSAGELLAGQVLLDALDAEPPQTRRVRLCGFGGLELLEVTDVRLAS